MNPIVFVLLAAVLIGVAFYLVALPLIQQGRRSAPAAAASSEQERLAELLAQRAAVFQAIRELNFDHRVGKITDDDFAAFEISLKQNAAESLRALDRWEAEADAELDRMLNRAVLARKTALASAPLVEADGRTCARCGAQAFAGDRFCSACGAELAAEPAPLAETPAVQLACPTCGATHLPEDKFCARCGQLLVVEAAPAAR